MSSLGGSFQAYIRRSQCSNHQYFVTDQLPRGSTLKRPVDLRSKLDVSTVLESNAGHIGTFRITRLTVKSGLRSIPSSLQR